MSLPIIDVSALLGTDEAAKYQVSVAIDQACREYGFFYIKGHGIAPETIEHVFGLGETFFALPEAEKLSIDITKSPNHRGYGAFSAEALEDGMPGDLKETFDMGRNLPDHDPEVLAGLPLHGANRYPDLPGWQQDMEAHYARMRQLSLLLLSAIARALDCPANYFEPLMTRTVSVLRLIHYPSAEHKQQDQQLGCGAHSDYGCITILAQRDFGSAPGGLQVKGLDGQWLDAPPIPGTFVINIGDLMARWTNDRYKSTLHRVINPSGAERYSMPFFVEPNFETEVTAFESCLSEGEAPKYDKVRSGDWIMSRFAATYSYRQDV